VAAEDRAKATTLEHQGNRVLLGYPITEPQVKTNAPGDRVLAQWFERARFESHPNNPAEYRVLLGRLAAGMLQQRGW
jgi:hypothetical protein